MQLAGSTTSETLHHQRHASQRPDLITRFYVATSDAPYRPVGSRVARPLWKPVGSRHTSRLSLTSRASGL